MFYINLKKGKKMQTVNAIVEELNNNVLALTSGYDLAGNPYIKKMVEQEAEIFNDYLYTLKECDIDLNDKKLLKNIEKEAQRTEKSIFLILDNQKKESEITLMSRMLLEISKKLDRVMIEQAAQKANLTKVELEVRNSEANLIKKIEEPYRVPIVPEGDMREIYDFYQFKLSEILQNLSRYGAEYYKNIYGEKFYDTLSTGWAKNDEKMRREKTEELTRAVYRAATHLILFVEDVETWTWSNSKNAKLRTVDYVELTKLENIHAILQRNKEHEGLKKEFRKVYDDVIRPQDKIPIKIKEAIKNHTYHSSVQLEKAYKARANLEKKEKLSDIINNYQS